MFRIVSRPKTSIGQSPGGRAFRLGPVRRPQALRQRLPERRTRPGRGRARSRRPGHGETGHGRRPAMLPRRVEPLPVRTAFGFATKGPARMEAELSSRSMAVDGTRGLNSVGTGFRSYAGERRQPSVPRNRKPRFRRWSSVLETRLEPLASPELRFPPFPPRPAQALPIERHCIRRFKSPNLPIIPGTKSTLA